MPKKILLADDSITIQKVVELTFSDGDYEVIAVNNGAKAVAKLSEIRPDIILSDIIMPEKNGYEVCEFVKSHPEYRNIPVILLTGTFEPFDPDRADKAGCDAVVTKPFESQSLIHKVEELIEQARSNAPTAQTPAISEKPAAPATPPASSWMEKTLEPPSSFTSAPAPSTPSSPFSRDTDMFNSGSGSTSSSEPFGAPPPAESFSGETRAVPKMSLDDAGKESSTQQVPAQPSTPPSSSPWDDQPPAISGEARAFPRMNFEEMQRPSQSSATPSSSSSSQSDNDSPFGASPSAESFSGETKAFPKMSMDDMKKMVAPEPPKSSASQESAPSPWDDQPAYSGGETKGFPKMNFDELQGASTPAPSSPSPWDEAPAAAAPTWPAATSDTSSSSSSASPSASSSASSSPSAGSGNGVDLTEEQVDRIARRVVQMISDQVVRNIAWEVIPDLAEMVVKERIRQLESEA